MTKWAAGLLLCAVVMALALLVVSPQIGGQQKTPAAPALGSGPEATANAPGATSYALTGMSYAQRYAIVISTTRDKTLGANYLQKVRDALAA